MRCDQVMAILEEMSTDELAPSLQQHLAGCAGCRGAREGLLLLRSGFRALAAEAVPEAPLGFSARLARRLSGALDPGRAAGEFMERIGRRFVWAGLMAAMLMLIALALPSSGPFRGPTTAEVYLAQPEPNPQTDVPILNYDATDGRDATPANATQGGNQK